MQITEMLISPAFLAALATLAAAGQFQDRGWASKSLGRRHAAGSVRSFAPDARPKVKRQMGEAQVMHSHSHLGFGAIGEKLHEPFHAPATKSSPLGDKTHSKGLAQEKSEKSKSSLASETAGKAALDEAIKIEFAMSKGMGKHPMPIPSLRALQAPTLMHAQTLGLLSPPKLKQLTKGQVLAKLRTVAPEDHYRAAGMGGGTSRDPAHYQRAALELYLDKVRPELRLAGDSMEEMRHLAAWNEKQLMRRPNRAQFEPYVLVHDPQAGAAERAQSARPPQGASSASRYHSL